MKIDEELAIAKTRIYEEISTTKNELIKFGLIRALEIVNDECRNNTKENDDGK